MEKRSRERNRRRHPGARLAVGLAAVVATTGVASLATPATAAVVCQVTYTVTSQWPGGFVADVAVLNSGDPLNGWTVTWIFPDGQAVTSAWNATIAVTGGQASATSVGWNSAVPSGRTVGFGFQGTWTTANSVPAAFAVNGVACGSSGTGSGTTTTMPTTTRPTTTTTGPTTTTRPTTTTTSTRTTTSTTTRSTTTTISSSGGGNSEGLVGFAGLSGYGRNGTNGGAGGETVTVTTYSQLAAAVADDAPRIVRVSGTITGSGSAMLDVGSNKTIVGVGSTATIDGFGLDVNGWGPEEVARGGDTCDPAERDTFPHVGNVIIQNLSFRNSPDDSVNVQCYSHHVWVTFNTFHPANDGSVDIKRGSDLVTVSRNRFVGTDKSMLLGHSDNNGAQDRGYLRVTYHHNHFDGSNTRHPRVRFGYAHVFGNYYRVSDYCLGLGAEAKIYADGNRVASAKTITQDFDSDAHLTWTATNVYDPATITRANDSGKTMADWLNADNTIAPPPYTYPAGPAPSTPPVAGAGASGSDRI